MKLKDIILLLSLTCSAGLIIFCSFSAKEGAREGLALAQNTIIPSLLPVLIIFLMIVKTSAKDVLAKGLGFISSILFGLPKVTFPAIILGLVGGYPTGAMLTLDLYKNGDIDSTDAKKMMRFNFCGGCGFIITALGTAVWNSTAVGVLLFIANIMSSITIGIALSLNTKRKKQEYYTFGKNNTLGDALVLATQDAVKSLLSMTAYIILFSAVNNIFSFSKFISPLIEITNGICTKTNLSLPLISAYLAFGGFCIHFQLLGIIKSVGMKYADFLLFRVIGSFLSYLYAKILFTFYPVEQAVFSSTSEQTVQLSSVNLALSALMILGCFVIVFDLNSRKKLC